MRTTRRLSVLCSVPPPSRQSSARRCPSCLFRSTGSRDLVVCRRRVNYFSDDKFFVALNFTMLFKLSVMLVVAVAANNVRSEHETCKPYFAKYCGEKTDSIVERPLPCSPLYGALQVRESQLGKDIRKYIKEHLGNSFEYLLQWANFKNYKKEREGFAKLYRKLSDDTWEDSIKLVQYLGKRGVELEFNNLIAIPVTQDYADKVASGSEIVSLAKVLDLHKQLAISGNSIHDVSIKHNTQHGINSTTAEHHHDVELAHFIEEEFAGKHAKTVRELAGHTRDLQRLLEEGGPDVEKVSTTTKQPYNANGLYIHLFDEYLRKLY